ELNILYAKQREKENGKDWKTQMRRSFLQRKRLQWKSKFQKPKTGVTPMFERIVWNLVASLILRQIEKFRTATQWDKVKADAEARIRKLVPGTWFDDEAAEAVRYIIDTVATALASKAHLEQ